MAVHQPKRLTELVFASFTKYITYQVRLLLCVMKLSPIPEEATNICRKLRDVFHGTRLPSGLANEITKRVLLTKDMCSVIDESKIRAVDYFEQILLPLVEVHMHPDVTSIELSPRHLHDLILLKVSSLGKLKTLSLEGGMNIFLDDVTLVFPSQLKELTLCDNEYFDEDNLERIVDCCRELKSLKIARCSIDDTSIPDILKLNRLEILHLLGDVGRGLDVDCVALINGISTDATSDVLSASTLKSFGIELRDENTLHLIVDKLPHLTEIVLQLRGEFDLSCLTQLKNLRSLILDAGGRTSDDYKKILPVLGKSLVCLDLGFYYNLDLEFIGKTCSNLRCLHVYTTGGVETHPRPSLKSFPNFRTVECLRVNMYQAYDWVEFLIAQCVNIKVLSVVYCRRATVIENVLKRITLTSLEEIHWYPAIKTNKSCLEELCLKCPNLRLVHGLGSDSFTSERVVFDLYECHKGLCKSYNWLLYISDFSCLG